MPAIGSRRFQEFLVPPGGATFDENHAAQTVLLAVCGFSPPNWPKAADLPGKQEVGAT
jgi:hypothetical protein